MESNERYYWRRASEELAAAQRAVTPAARRRRQQLAESYLSHLRTLARGREPGFAREVERLSDQLPA